RARDERAVALAHWIIRDFGGIKAGDLTTVALWMTELRDFNADNVKVFIGAHDTREVSSRISSWSKLLAFADRETHAIYDARTTLALNCVFRSMGNPCRFYMPDGQNRTIRD